MNISSRVPYVPATLTVVSCVLLAACLASGPQKTLDDMAEALQKNDSAAFLACLDVTRFAANEIKNITRENQALNSLNSLGRAIGLGKGMVDELLGGVLNMEAHIREQYTHAVNTGELEKQCGTSLEPDCPWTTQALKNAQIKKLGEDAAVASVTPRAGATSWLALRKKDDRWLVVGRAPREDIARNYAVGEAPASENKNRTADNVTKI
ncbi:MAG: hypothetical protein LBR31_02695 [Desulfovibrio sp.]|nr:hypothetical protein [Desulfovibrio sp.]